jgi:hypothetical protein
MHEWSDARTGKVTVGVIAAMALVIASLVTGILVYATSWGYAVRF